MEIQRQRSDSFYLSSRLHLTAAFVSLTTGAAIAVGLCARGNYRDAAVITAMSLGIAFVFSGAVTLETVMLAWFVTTPVASFYLRYPLDRSIITYDRLIFFLLLLLMLIGTRSIFFDSFPDVRAKSQEAAFSLTKFELAWALLSILALASGFLHSNNLAYSVRIAVDAFWLPLFAFYFARRYFSMRNSGRMLVIGCIALAMFLFVNGSYEVATGVDLFQYKGAELVREGERRVNGPFLSDSSFAIICLLLFVILQAAPRLIRLRFDRSGKLIYFVATVCAGLGALLSAFRVVAMAIFICWIGQIWLEHRTTGKLFWKSTSIRRRLLPAAAIGIILVLFGGWFVLRAAPALGARLIDPRSAFGRLATWQAATIIAFENPLFGVGLGNYADYFDQSHYYSDEEPEEVLETKAANSPHSNLLWIASELGFPGLVLYIAANVFLFLIGWRGLKAAADRQQVVAYSCYIALVLAYWISGLTLASGYYSDLNLYFLFFLGALSAQFRKQIHLPPVSNYI
ncbi:MAG TPA: O-antigen ligase family protein [Blastocatellia bacterium]|nr:O-antigen ligase family protein [Blastocatellia bacterium]